MTTTETPAPETAPAAEPPLQRADGIELVGEYKDSGFKTPPWIVRRSDGQVVQLPRLLYLVAEHADGSRSHDEIGARVSEAIQRGVDGAAVGMLAENLRELGVLAARDGSSPQIEKVDPLLGLKFKTAVIPERVTRAFTTVFRPLFAKPVVALVVPALLALDVWLLFIHGISPGLREVIYSPVLLLMLLGGVVLATAFHEIGHATACRYGGAEPGVMGVGIYVVWPAFYTDVTDAYRLGKGGRLRTDLGGIYFNAIFALAMAALYAVTSFEPLLLLVLIQNFAMIQQLLPLLRARRLLHHQRPHRRAGHVLAHQAGAAERAPRPQGERPRDRAQAARAPGGDRVRPHGGADPRLLVRPDAAARAARVRHRLRLARRAVGQGLGGRRPRGRRRRWDPARHARAPLPRHRADDRTGRRAAGRRRLALVRGRAGAAHGACHLRRRGARAAGVHVVAERRVPPDPAGRARDDPGRRRVAGRDPDRAPEPDRRA